MKLRTCSQGELSRAWPAFATEFDEKELLSRLAVRRALLRGDMELLALTDEQSGIDTAYALVGCRDVYGYVWLKYLTVLPWYRERGVGIEMMRQLHKRYCEKQGVVAELTDFGDDVEQTLRALRKFFARFGYIEVESGARLGGVEDHVMVKPIRAQDVPEKQIRRVMLDFYSRVTTPLGRQKMLSFED